MSELRKQRCIIQKIYLIETIPSNDLYEKEYVIMGSTGNVYNVIIKKNPECSCPDFVTRHNRCKHIYFVLIKIMNITNVDQENFTNEQLIDMFCNIPKVALLIDDNKKQKYELLKSVKSKTIPQKNIDDICPICLDDLDDGSEIDFCKFSCGKTIHKLCFSMWIKKMPANCVYCKNSWYGHTNNQYINLQTK
jgi:hypothetical protein